MGCAGEEHWWGVQITAHTILQLYTQFDVEKALSSIAATLTDTSNSWDLRVSAVSTNSM